MSVIFLLGIIQTELPSSPTEDQAPLVTNIYKTSLALFGLQCFMVLLTDKFEMIYRFWWLRKVGVIGQHDEKYIQEKAHKAYIYVNFAAFIISTIIQSSVIFHYFNQVFNHNYSLPFNTQCRDEGDWKTPAGVCFWINCIKS